MQIGIIAPGSQGDVQPFLALGKGLTKAGNTVRLVTNQDYEKQVKSHGIEFWPIEVNMEDIIRTEKMREQAAELGTKIQAEDGVSRAIDIIENYIGM